MCAGVVLAGLAALSGHAEVAFVSSTDMPFLHPAFIRRVLDVAAQSTGTDVVLPVARGFKQPLAAAYRVSLAAGDTVLFLSADAQG
jgi:molybdopterin-guanine dinucleotide biosynthesis protein A